MDGKEPTIRQDFIWGAGLSAIKMITKGEFSTDPDIINTEKLIQLFKDYITKGNTNHSRGNFFWIKQEDNATPEDHWRKLVSLERNCEFKDIKHEEDLLISKLITSITGKKLREKLIRQKTLNLKTIMDLVPTRHL